MGQIDQILTLTDQVQQYVDDGRWAEARALEKDRLALLTELFSRDDVAAIGPECEQLARDLLARNAQMAETIQARRGDLQATTRRVTAAAGAVSAYSRNEPTSHWGDRHKPAHALSD